MSSPRGAASYKKKPGVIAVASDLQSVSWAASDLQQTPANSPKVMLKIIEQSADGSGTESHTIVFASNDQGRTEAGAIRDALSKAIAPLKAANAPASARNDGMSAAMAIAAAVSGSPDGGSSYDDDKLLADGELQASFLKKDKQLASTFHQAMKSRPSSVAITAFNRQFWLSRVRLLRAFAVEQAQKKGEYNVLSTFKSHMDGDVPKLSLTAEQAQLILRQYPVVRKANQEASQRKIDQNAFWTRFFQSRLHKKLKGERILENDKKDDLLDKYLNYQNDDLEREKKLLAAHVPLTIDLEGNMQDNSQKLGNAPDYLNRPAAVERVPIMRTLNSMSEMLLAQVKPNDVDPSEPIGVDEATFNEMALKDLAGDLEAQHRPLTIKDKAKFFATGKGGEEIGIANIFDKQNPKQVLLAVTSDLQKSRKSTLTEAIGVDDSDPDEDLDDEEKPRDTHVGSRASRKQATRQIFQLVRERRSQVHDQLAGLDEDEIAKTFGLSANTYREAILANAAAVVFLNHFWSAFQSGDASRAGELQGVVEALGQYKDTFKGIGETADKERQKIIEERTKLIRSHFEKTGKKVPLDQSSIKGGHKVIDQLFSSTVKPIERAQDVYQRAMATAKRAEMQNE